MTIEVSDKQLAALVRGDAVAVGPSKRVITLDDGPFVVNRSYPAPHCGRPGEVGGSAPRGACAVSRESTYALFQNIPKTKRWDAVRKGLDAIDSVHGIDVWQALPIKETRSEKKGASYHILDRQPTRFMVKMHDEYGENTEISIVHEVGHHIDHWLLGEKEPYGPVWFSEAMAAQYGLNHHQLSVCGTEDMVERLRGYAVQDFTEFPGSVNYTLESARKPSDELSMKGIYLWDAITDSQAYRALKEYPSGRNVISPIPEDYFVGDRNNPSWVAAGKTFDKPITTDIPYSVMKVLKSPRETFARAYSQYIATRSGDKEMMRAVDETIGFTRAGGVPVAWEWDDFEPIANAFDSLFRSKGWMNE